MQRFGRIFRSVAFSVVVGGFAAPPAAGQVSEGLVRRTVRRDHVAPRRLDPGPGRAWGAGFGLPISIRSCSWSSARTPGKPKAASSRTAAGPSSPTRCRRTTRAPADEIRATKVSVGGVDIELRRFSPRPPMPSTAAPGALRRRSAASGSARSSSCRLTGMCTGPATRFYWHAAFHKAVTVSGAPVLAQRIGEEMREARYRPDVRSLDGLVYFTYTVQAGDCDMDGVGLPANAISGGSIREADGARKATRRILPRIRRERLGRRAPGMWSARAGAGPAGTVAGPAGRRSCWPPARVAGRFLDGVAGASIARNRRRRPEVRAGARRAAPMVAVLLLASTPLAVDAGRGASGRRSAGAGGAPGGRAGRRVEPDPRDDAGRGRGAGVVARGDAKPARGVRRGDGGRRLPRAAPERHGVGGPGGGAVGRGSRQPGRGRPEGPASHHHPVVQRQQPTDQRRGDRGPPRHAAQPRPGPHAGPRQRQAPSPLLGRRLAWRERRGVRVAGPGHSRHPRHRASPGRGVAGRRGGPVRLGRDRRGVELPAQGRPCRRVLRARHRDVPRRGRGNGAVRRQCRPAAGGSRVRQPQPGVRQREPDRPGGASARCARPHRGRQHARPLGESSALGRPGRRRRREAVRQLRLRPAGRGPGLRPHELRPQDGELQRLLSEPEHPPRPVQQRLAAARSSSATCSRRAAWARPTVPP